MAAFGQTTIHSKLAKFEKTHEDNSTGRVVKGVNTQYNSFKVPPISKEIMKEILVLPKNKLNIDRKIKNKAVLTGVGSHDEIVLMESSSFPSVYFKKTALRNVLKEFSFPPNCIQVEKDDPRTSVLFQVLAQIFNQITLYIFNILSCQNTQTGGYFIFLSDCETLPFAKCCNAPVFIQLQPNGSGRLLCNSAQCSHPCLAQFLVNFDDGKKLWPSVSYFSQASSKDKQLKNRISKLIANGRFKRQSLVGMVQDTSKDIVNLFYQSKHVQNSQQNQTQPNYNDMFMTGTGIQNNYVDDDVPTNIQKQTSQLLEQDNNLEISKMKLLYISKKNKDLIRFASKSVAQQSKIFQHDFDIIKKIDEQMLKNRNSKANTKITFPQLMSQITRGNKTKRNTKSHSFYK